MSEVQNIVSPGLAQNILSIDAANATAYPPVSRCTPFGFPVVPEVYKIYDGSVASTQVQGTLASK